MAYRIRRVDKNQSQIVKKLRSLGARVLVLSDVGNGVPDILVGILRPNKPPFLHLIEIKNGDLCNSAQKLTKDEQKFHEEWLEFVTVINSVDGVVDFMEKALTGCV